MLFIIRVRLLLENCLVPQHGLMRRAQKLEPIFQILKCLPLFDEHLDLLGHLVFLTFLLRLDDEFCRHGFWLILTA